MNLDEEFNKELLKYKTYTSNLEIIESGRNFVENFSKKFSHVGRLLNEKCPDKDFIIDELYNALTYLADEIEILDESVWRRNPLYVEASKFVYDSRFIGEVRRLDYICSKALRDNRKIRLYVAKDVLFKNKDDPSVKELIENTLKTSYGSYRFEKNELVICIRLFNEDFKSNPFEKSNDSEIQL